MFCNSRIILIKIATYYSQNYAGILGSGLMSTIYILINFSEKAFDNVLLVTGCLTGCLVNYRDSRVMQPDTGYASVRNIYI